MEIDLLTIFYLCMAFFIFSIFPTHLYYVIKKESDAIFLLYLSIIAAIFLNILSQIYKSHPLGDLLISTLWYAVILVWVLSFIEIRLRRW